MLAVLWTKVSAINAMLLAFGIGTAYDRSRPMDLFGVDSGLFKPLVLGCLVVSAVSPPFAIGIRLFADNSTIKGRVAACTAVGLSAALFACAAVLVAVAVSAHDPVGYLFFILPMANCSVLAFSLLERAVLWPRS